MLNATSTNVYVTLSSIQGALRIVETLLKSNRNETGTLFDIKVYTDSDYAWKFVKSKGKFLELGSHYASKGMPSQLDRKDYGVNIDILHPLARSFSRLNSLDNTSIEFIHSMDAISLNARGLGYVKSLKHQARSAAMWQYNRE